MDLGAIGDKVKTMYPQYGKMDSQALGLKYMTKFGANGAKALGITSDAPDTTTKYFGAAPTATAPVATAPVTSPTPITPPAGGLTVPAATQQMQQPKQPLDDSTPPVDPEQTRWQTAYKSAPAGGKDQVTIANNWKAANGYGLFESKPLTKAQQTAAAAKDDAKTTVKSFYDMLDSYQSANPTSLHPFEYNDYIAQKNLFADSLAKTLGVSRSNPAVVRIINNLPGGRVDAIDGAAQGKFTGTLKQVLDRTGHDLKTLGLDDKLGIYNKNNKDQKAAPSGNGSLLGNAGKDIGNMAAGALNIPLNIAKDTLKTGDFNKAVGDQAINMAKGTLDEYGKVVPFKFQNGQVAFAPDKTINHFQQHPVNTILDALPLVGGAVGKLRGGAVAGDTGAAAMADEAAAGAPKTGLPQNAVRSAADFINGGGSKEYIQRTSRGAVPQNEVLLREGILSHPTETGRIQATQKALDTHGQNLADIYKNSDRVFKGDTFGKTLDAALTEKGYDSKAINFIKMYMNKQGDFELGSGDQLITLDKAWKTAQKLESNPPKMLKNPETAGAFRDLSKDAARVIREELAKKAPESLHEKAAYGALRDYMDNKLSDPQGATITAPGHGGIAGAAVSAAKDAINPILNKAYNATSAPSAGLKLVRDMRFKQGSPQFKSK